MTVLRMKQGDTLTLDVGPVRDAAGVVQDITGSTLRFTAKARLADADADALLTGSTGDGRIVLVDPVAGMARVTIPAELTTGLGRRVLVWDVQLSQPGLVRTLDEGTLIVSVDVTRAT